MTSAQTLVWVVDRRDSPLSASRTAHALPLPGCRTSTLDSVSRVIDRAKPSKCYRPSEEWLLSVSVSCVTITKSSNTTGVSEKPARALGATD